VALVFDRRDEMDQIDMPVSVNLIGVTEQFLLLADK
jgi:hypothetical protein